MSVAEKPGEAPLQVRRARRRSGLSIQSIVLIMLLTVSLASNVLVGLIGYFNATSSLQDAAFQRLTEVRDSRAREIDRLLETIQNSIVVNAQGETVISATEEFTAAFAELDALPDDEARDAAIAEYYDTVFGPRLTAVSGDVVDAQSFAPSSRAAQELQLLYTVPHETFEAAIEVDDAGDGSDWSATHARVHPYFRTLVDRSSYEDILLIDSSGTVVYTAYKGVDLGTNVATGPYRFSALGAAFVETISSNVLDGVVFTDLESYAPSLGEPAGWAMTPVARDGVIIGALAVELPLARFSEIMLAGSDGTQGGLGETGEAYLVGSDGLMRSPSRLFAEDPVAFAEAAAAAGIPAETVELAEARDDTIAVLPIRTDAVDSAREGKTGTVIGQSYLGRETLAAYRPLGGLMPTWVVVAETSTQEAFAPVTDFTRNLVISSAVLALIVSVISLVLARILVSPFRRLASAAKRIAAGETNVTVDAGTSDEVVQVATAFNEMSRSLQVKADLLDQQSEETERLLRSLMPEPVIRRYREGATTIAEDHRAVSVMFADIIGFEEYSRHLDSQETLERLNELVKQFDEAGARLGVEHVRTTTKGYLASCGLTVPRVDNARRMVEFALELEEILERYSAQWGASLRLRAGIDVGDLTSGLVGQSHMIYDLWGEAVNLAFQLQGDHHDSGIFLTERVLDGLPERPQLVDAGTIESGGTRVAVWRIVEATHA